MDFSVIFKQVKTADYSVPGIRTDRKLNHLLSIHIDSFYPRWSPPKMGWGHSTRDRKQTLTLSWRISLPPTCFLNTTTPTTPIPISEHNSWWIPFTPTQGWTLAPVRPPATGNFGVGRVNSQKYPSGWRVTFSPTEVLILTIECRCKKTPLHTPTHEKKPPQQQPHFKACRSLRRESGKPPPPARCKDRLRIIHWIKSISPTNFQCR